MEDEARVFRQMQEGDWTAFNLFFKAYTERLYHYALGFVKERAVAEDLVQDAFIYLWTNRERIAFTGSVYAYLLQAVKNACINYKAHQEVEEKYRKGVGIYEIQEDTEAEWEALRQRVMSAVDSLPPKCREIFILGAIEGMTYQQTAERLGVSVNTVKTQMKFAYRKVREQAGDSQDLFVVLSTVCGFLLNNLSSRGNIGMG